MSFITHDPSTQLESNLSKKDEMIAAKDRRIAALEKSDTLKSTTSRNAALYEYLQQAVANEPSQGTLGETIEVSDDSCDAVSEGSFGSLGLSFLRQDSSRDEDSTVDGRWNVPFDDDNEDDLVPKPSIGEGLSRTIALTDIRKPITKSDDVDSLEKTRDRATSPIRPVAVRSSILPFRPEVSPIVQAGRSGVLRVDSAGSDKENIGPMRKNQSAYKYALSQGLGRPCR